MTACLVHQCITDVPYVHDPQLYRYFMLLLNALM